MRFRSVTSVRFFLVYQTQMFYETQVREHFSPIPRELTLVVTFKAAYLAQKPWIDMRHFFLEWMSVHSYWKSFRVLEWWMVYVRLKYISISWIFCSSGIPLWWRSQWRFCKIFLLLSCMKYTSSFITSKTKRNSRTTKPFCSQKVTTIRKV